MQEDLSHAIVSALQLSLPVTRVRREDPEAHQLYLKGRFFWHRGTEDGLRRALEFFSAAITPVPMRGWLKRTSC